MRERYFLVGIITILLISFSVFGLLFLHSNIKESSGQSVISKTILPSTKNQNQEQVNQIRDSSSFSTHVDSSSAKPKNYETSSVTTDLVNLDLSNTNVKQDIKNVSENLTDNGSEENPKLSKPSLESVLPAQVQITSPMPLSICVAKRINVSVSGEAILTRDGLLACGPYGFGYGGDFRIRVSLMEKDSLSSDDVIASRDLIIHKSCSSTNDISLAYSYTFKDIDLSSQFGGIEDSNTIEVYAKVEPMDLDKPYTLPASTQVYDINKDPNCNQCDSGSCCDLNTKKFLPQGATPNGYSDENICSATNSPTSTNYVIKRSFSCDGKGNIISTDNTLASCGVCGYCSVDAGQCQQYNHGEFCGTKSCDNFDTACRDYKDVSRGCSVDGTCSNPTCDNYVNKDVGTSCGAGLECDGQGNCVSAAISCTSHSASQCHNGDVYWYDSCGQIEDKKQSCSSGCEFGTCKANIQCNKDVDCGSSGRTVGPYCKEGNVYMDYQNPKCENPGTSASACGWIGDSIKQETCSNGCTEGKCNPAAPDNGGNNGGADSGGDNTGGNTNTGGTKDNNIYYTTSDKNPDFDKNGVVGFNDFLMFNDAFNRAATGDYAKFDLDGSGTVDFGDFLIFNNEYNKKVVVHNDISPLCSSFCDTGQKAAFCDTLLHVTDTFKATCLALATEADYAGYGVSSCPTLSCVKTPQELDETCVTGLGGVWEAPDTGGGCIQKGDTIRRVLSPSDNPPVVGQICCTPVRIFNSTG